MSSFTYIYIIFHQSMFHNSFNFSFKLCYYLVIIMASFPEQILFAIIPVLCAFFLAIFIYLFRIRKVRYPVNSTVDPPNGYNFFKTTRINESVGGSSRKFSFLNIFSLLVSFGLILQLGFLLWIDFLDADLPYNATIFWIVFFFTLIFTLVSYIFLIRNWSSLDYRFRKNFTKRNILILLLILFTLNIVMILYWELSIITFLVLLLLTPATLFYSWMLGKFSILFLLQQFGVTRGWDPLEASSASNNKSLKSIISKATAFYLIITISLSPILAVNSLLSLFFSEPSEGGFMGQFLFEILGVNPFVELIVLLIILGPLTAIALKPSGFLEQWLYSPLYDTIVNWDWETFSLAIKRDNSILRLSEMDHRNARNTSFILGIFLSFASIQALAGIILKFPLTQVTSQSTFLIEIVDPLKLLEVVFFLIFFLSNFVSLHEEKEFWNTMDLGRLEQKDLLNYRLWAMDKLSRQDYDPIIKSSQDSWHEKNFFPKFYAANAYRQVGNFEKQLALYEEVLPYQPNNIEVLDNLATAYISLEKNDEAEKLLLKSININKRNAIAYHNLGILYNIKGDISLAEKNFRKAIDIGHIKAFLSWQQLTDIFERTDRLDEGIAICKKGIKDHPDDSLLYGRLAYIYSKQDNQEEALKTYKKANELNPDDATILVNLALAMDRLNYPYDEVFLIYKNAVEKNPTDAMINFNFGSYIARSGNPEQALPYFQRSKELNPAYSESWYNLSVALYQLDKYNEAIANATEMIEQFGDIIKVHYLLGECHYFNETMEDARHHYEKTVELDPSNHLSYYRLGLIHAGRNEVDMTIKYWEKVIEIAPSNIQAWGDLGRAYMVVGRVDDAERIFKEAISIDSSLIGLHYELAHVYAVKQEYETCKDILKQVLSMDPKVMESIMEDNIFEEFRNTEQFKELL